MHEEPVDLSALRLEGARREQMVWEIVAGARPLGARRTVPRGPLLMLAGWSRPAMAAGFLIAALSSLALLAARPSAAEQIATARIPEVLGLPHTVADWLNDERGPTTTDLVGVLEGGF